MDVEVDKLSSLPDCLIHRILSYVDIVYSTRLSVLSSRWSNSKIVVSSVILSLAVKDTKLSVKRIMDIISTRLLDLKLKKLDWYVEFVLVDTPQLKNLICVDTHPGKYISGSICELSGGLILSARDLTYLHIKGSCSPKISLDGFVEKVDLCISSPQKTYVHKICKQLQRLHSHKSLALSLEIVEDAATWDGGKGTWGGREKGFGTVPVCVRVQE
nr:F-box domain, leucine-rich repeat domain, L domain-like protein [Tanacetum cinerariifolium]